MIATYGDVVVQTGVALPGHLSPADDVKVVKTFAAQGDVYLRREPITPREAEGVPATHIKVVEGDAARNAHILHGEGSRWYPGVYKDQLTDYGVLVVPEGRYAYLVHTAEHGPLALGAGTWRLWAQVSYESELRRVLD